MRRVRERLCRGVESECEGVRAGFGVARPVITVEPRTTVCLVIVGFCFTVWVRVRGDGDVLEPPWVREEVNEGVPVRLCVVALRRWVCLLRVLPVEDWRRGVNERSGVTDRCVMVEMRFTVGKRVRVGDRRKRVLV